MFVRAFFAANPLSQLALSCCRGGRCERLSEMGGAPEQHIKALDAALKAPNATGGSLSLQNCFEQAASQLGAVPPYATRELLLLQSALATCDPSNVHAAVAAAKAARVRVSVVSLSAEVHVAKRAARDTGGLYAVALSESHAGEALMAHAPPPPSLASSTAASLVRMGFPVHAPAGPSHAVVGDAGGEFVCPRCEARVGELPATCGVCALTLVSSPHLARSYHHLFPVPPYDEEDAAGEAGGEAGACYGCGECVGRGSRGISTRCPRCAHRFCFACDAYVHEQLHNCPGCEAAAG